MMRKINVYVLSIVLLLSFSSGLLAQDEIVYQHPSLGIQFIASPYWNQVDSGNDNMAYELINQNKNMHMRVWYQKSEKSVKNYLRSEICKDGLVDEKPFECRLDNQDAYGICAICSEMRRPFKVMLIALPTEDGMYLLRFKCPEECYTEHQKQIQKLLDSIRLNPVVERTVFYASNY